MNPFCDGLSGNNLSVQVKTMHLKLIGLSPHPPVMIPEIGRGDLKQIEKTVAGLRKLCGRIKAAQPQLLVVITPHGPVLRDGIAVPGMAEISGSFAQFGAPALKITMQTDQELLRLLEQETRGEPVRPVILPAQARRFPGLSLDHGALVPLYYLQQAGVSVPGLHLTPGFLPYRDLFRFGQALRRAIEKRGLPAAVVASGDLSHRLIPGAPAGFNPRGAEFDRLLVELLRAGRFAEVLDLDESLIEAAGECGLRSFAIALGLLGAEPFQPEIISYEGPFGVGYLVAALQPPGADSPPKSRQGGTGRKRPQEPGEPVRLAREALRYYLEHGSSLTAPQPVPTGLAVRAGAFVSLKKRGELRGCIGTVEPACKNLAEEIIANAVSAAVNDPRFSPVRLEELDQLSISVDILTPLEKIGGPEELDPKKYGVLVRSGHRSGLLLPDLEGIDTVEEQIAIARRKAGIAPHEPVQLFRFSVTRHT
jgi:AmmeMemoRadiSam system protein A